MINKAEKVEPWRVMINIPPDLRDKVELIAYQHRIRPTALLRNLLLAAIEIAEPKP